MSYYDSGNYLHIYLGSVKSVFNKLNSVNCVHFETRMEFIRNFLLGFNFTLTIQSTFKNHLSPNGLYEIDLVRMLELNSILFLKTYVSQENVNHNVYC